MYRQMKGTIKEEASFPAERQERSEDKAHIPYRRKGFPPAFYDLVSGDEKVHQGGRRLQAGDEEIDSGASVISIIPLIGSVRIVRKRAGSAPPTIGVLFRQQNIAARQNTLHVRRGFAARSARIATART